MNFSFHQNVNNPSIWDPTQTNEQNTKPKIMILIKLECLFGLKCVIECNAICESYKTYVVHVQMHLDKAYNYSLLTF